MHRRDWLVLFLQPTEPGSPSLDPIRIQKGMFYFAREAAVPQDQKYHFVPYYYGPCSFDIYTDIDALADDGLVEPVPVDGQSWKRYRLTPEGLNQASGLAAEAPAQALEVCRSARAKVVRHTFRSLLKEVYKEYPEYAIKSVAELP